MTGEAAQRGSTRRHCGRVLALIGLALLSVLAWRPAGAAIDLLLRPPEIIQAAEAGDADWVRRILLTGGQPDARDSNGRTPLIVAVGIGHLGIVRDLLQHGASVNLADELGNTPLYWAADRGHIQIMQALIEAGANLDRRNGDGMTPLIAAVRRNNPTATEVLIGAGADLNIRDFTGRSALGWAEIGRSQGLAARLRGAGGS